MSKPKRETNRTKTVARRRAGKKDFMIVFINGKQKRVRRPLLIDGLPVEEFLARNSDPIWLHENECWELIPE